MSRASAEKLKSPPDPKAAQEAKPQRRDSMRELVEQIVIAFILAFVVRGFEAEAFVIPTGSMAPTLMGAHKDIDCPYCGFNFTVNAANEFSDPSNPMSAVLSGLCGNCQAPLSLEREPTFNGDRILVMKYLFNIPFLSQKPKRWEVIVFHYPGNPETNYIKRLVGLPGEQLRLYYGDVLSRPDAGSPFVLQRKPLMHQEAMQMNVWDDRHRPKLLADRPEWQRWQPQGEQEWTQSKPGTFETRASGSWNELRYRHLVPDPAQWYALLGGGKLPYAPRTQLISDFYGYNAGWYRPLYPEHRFLPQHWVGDLTIAGRVQATSNSGTVRIELIESGISNRCEIDLSTGKAQLYHGDTALGEPAATSFKGAGKHDVRLANVDGRLTLWIDGQTPFGEGRIYQEGMDDFAPPTEEDLEPVRIAARDADVVVSDLVLTRDIYYSLDPHVFESDYSTLGVSPEDLMSDPAKFPMIGEILWKDYTIQPGHYMMLGDNSPRSADGRAWDGQDRNWDENRTRQDFEVPESFLIGKAFFVYWPHGKPFWPSIPFLGNPNFRIPFRPYVERMKWIR
jgi:signal peptidase I